MGKVLIDLDAQFFNKEKSYLFLYSTGKYEDAYAILQQMNASLPSDARLSDFPDLKMEGNSLRAEMEYEGYVQEMCKKWAKNLNLSVATYRETMIEDLNR